MRFLAVCSLALLLAVTATSGQSAREVIISGCGNGRHDQVSALMPLKTGPLTLARIDCFDLRSGAFSVTPPTPSTDLKSVFVFDTIQGLSIVQAGNAMAFQHFDGALATLSSRAPFTWSKDSRSVFGVRQKTVKPNGWALGPLRPTLFQTDGTSKPLVVLTNPSEPLDEVYWIGQSGIAIAAFGTKGKYYRPEHRDPNPTLAIIDAGKGQLLQSVPIADLPGATPTSRIGAVASDGDGRHALITFSPNLWIFWGRGQSPRSVPIGLKTWQTPYTLAPGGKGVLIMKNLSAVGIICEHNPKCPPPTPKTGPIAQFHALPSGKPLWSVSGTAKTFSSSDVPAISPDGRFALISMPAYTVALVSMEHGTVLQQLPKPWTSECAMGFSGDGKLVWISGGSRIVFYRLKT